MSFYRASSERQTRLAPDRIQHSGDFARMGGPLKILRDINIANVTLTLKQLVRTHRVKCKVMLLAR